MALFDPEGLSFLSFLVHSVTARQENPPFYHNKKCIFCQQSLLSLSRRRKISSARLRRFSVCPVPLRRLAHPVGLRSVFAARNARRSARLAASRLALRAAPIACTLHGACPVRARRPCRWRRPRPDLPKRPRPDGRSKKKAAACAAQAARMRAAEQNPFRRRVTGYFPGPNGRRGRPP